MEQLILGIDSGGSKTIACLGRLSDSGPPLELGRGTAGPANLQSVDRSVVLENITDAVAAAFVAAGVRRCKVTSAVLAAAGSDRDENRRVFSEWANEIALADRFRIVHDAWPVLAAGTPECWGVALISGTGSIAFGRAADGRTTRAGGWGFLFGDEGSGYALAVAGFGGSCGRPMAEGCRRNSWTQHLGIFKSIGPRRWLPPFIHWPTTGGASRKWRNRSSNWLPPVTR